jgi:hypothetical protein
MSIRSLALETIKGTVKHSVKLSIKTKDGTVKYVPKAAKATRLFGKDTWASIKQGWTEGASK